jgi:hypothetical protein
MELKRIFMNGVGTKEKIAFLVRSKRRGLSSVLVV